MEIVRHLALGPEAALHVHHLAHHAAEQRVVAGAATDGVTPGTSAERVAAAAAIEQNHDDKGIIWPLPLAPFEVVLVLLNSNVDEVVAATEEIGLVGLAIHEGGLRKPVGAAKCSRQRSGAGLPAR
mgnify:CR=1 FL=1